MPLFCFFQRTRRFLKEFNLSLPNSFIYPRKFLAIKKIIPQCVDKGFTDLIIVNDDRGIPSKCPRNLYCVSYIRIVQIVTKFQACLISSVLAFESPQTSLNSFKPSAWAMLFCRLLTYAVKNIF